MILVEIINAVIDAIVGFFSPTQTAGSPVATCPPQPPAPAPTIAFAADGAKYVTEASSYKDCPEAVKSDIKSKEFTEDEKKQINEVIKKYDKLMKCKDIPLKRFGRTDKGITDCKSENTTMGECFSESGSLILMDNSTSLVDFADKETQFKGTAAHEMAHIMLNKFDPRTCTSYASNGDNPLIQEWRKATGWDASGTNLTETDSDKAPSEYAKTNSQEDMSESAMFYLYDPERLKKASPERYNFMKSLFGD